MQSGRGSEDVKFAQVLAIPEVIPLLHPSIMRTVKPLKLLNLYQAQKVKESHPLDSSMIDKGR